METPLSNERGAVLILVAVAVFTLVAFSAIVVDYGILWASRGQAQTAADAGALAGAIAFAGNASNAHASASATVFAQSTAVWGANTAAADITVHPLPYPCPASAGGGTEGCIRVDVMRGAPGFDGTAHTNTLPVFFASMLGIASQAVRATATAQSAQGNAAECPTPWAVADKWLEVDAPIWDQLDLFALGTDIYRAPLVGEPGPATGFSLATDKGYQIALKDSDPGEWSAGWSRIIEFGPNGGSVIPELISGCPEWVPQVGLWDGEPCENKDHEDPAGGCINVKEGVVQGPNRHGVEDLIAQDPTAYWNSATQEVVSPKGVSPRIRPTVLFHPEDYVEDVEIEGCGGDNCMIKVVNIFGFFVEGFCDDLMKDNKLEPYVNCGKFENKTIVGRMVKVVGQRRGGSGTGTPGSSFSQVIRLVR
jgi:hypothetical protein